MIAVLWVELTEWRQAECRRSLMLLTLSLGAVFLVTAARPDWCLAALTANLLWLSLRAGQGRWNQASPEDWLATAGLKPGQVVAGKAGAVWCLNLLLILISLPLLTALQILWGIPWRLLGNVCLLWLGAAAVVAMLPLVLGKLGDYGELLAVATVGGWLIATLMLKGLAVWNPFIQVFRIMQGREVHAFQWCGVYFGLAAVLALLLLVRLRRVVQA